MLLIFIYQCFNASLEKNVHNFDYQFSIIDNGSNDRITFQNNLEQLKSKTKLFLSELIASERDINQSIIELVDNNPSFTNLISYMYTYSNEFKSKHLNQSIEFMLQAMKNSIQNKSEAFISFAKNNLVTKVEDFYQSFHNSISDFSILPNDIIYRFNQIVSFASQDLSRIHIEIGKLIDQTVNYDLKYIYQIIKNQLVSFVRLNKEINEISTLAIDRIQLHINKYIDIIEKTYNNNLNTLLQKDGDVDFWNVSWINTELQRNIIPKTKSIYNKIVADIDSLTNLQSDYSSQSVKLNYIFENTFKDNKHLINIGTTALDGCLRDLSSIQNDMKHISQNILNNFKLGLLAFDNILDKFDDELLEKYNSKVIGFINSLIFPDINHIFSTSLSFQKQIDNEFEVLKTNLLLIIQSEIQKLKTEQVSKPAINKDYYNTFFNNLQENFNKQTKDSFKKYNDEVLEHTQLIIPHYDEIILKIVSEMGKEVKENIHNYNDYSLFKKQFSSKAVIINKINIINNNIYSVSSSFNRIIEDKLNSLTDDLNDKMKQLLEWANSTLLSEIQLSSERNEEFNDQFYQSMNIKVNNFNTIIEDQLIKSQLIISLKEQITKQIFYLKQSFKSTSLPLFIKSISIEIENEVTNEIGIQSKLLTNYLSDTLLPQSNNSIFFLFNNVDFFVSIKD